MLSLSLSSCLALRCVVASSRAELTCAVEQTERMLVLLTQPTTHSFARLDDPTTEIHSKAKCFRAQALGMNAQTYWQNASERAGERASERTNDAAAAKHRIEKFCLAALLSPSLCIGVCIATKPAQCRLLSSLWLVCQSLVQIECVVLYAGC